LPFTIPKIYPITDTRLSGLSHAEQVKELIAAGAELVQLRDKHAGPREFYRDCLRSVMLAHASGVKVIVNDRVDIAVAVGADGVHLGQDDLPPEAARMLLGRSAIIGYSTHSVSQAIAAAQLPVDYIAIGPVFPTRTKQDPDAVVGLDGVRCVAAAVGDLPVVGIGGITLENARSVLDAGASSVAVISGLFRSNGSIYQQMQSFMNLAVDQTF
jgi:thiamine-phosphate pyrophosphorylase